ncbi:proline racemase [Aspergillus pseudoustus]|uniref:trans-L-3-hydroxyproline dehydratase n=1 Tax=Aspergillus pseudoustus TaxID=1810923 RepID=A0ABR4KD93_9EURO
MNSRPPPIPLPAGVGAIPLLFCIEMHTYGMPTYLVISGYPALTGTLLSQKATAQRDHDDIRRRILHEPRGHADAFGAILRPHTEHTLTKKAHMGVLYVHGHGYSTMCGHATIAAARFLVDCWDEDIFPRRREVVFHRESESVMLVLHTPGGLVEVVVPTVPGEEGRRVDVGRQIGFVALAAWAISTALVVDIPSGRRWGELECLGRDGVSVSLAFCGTFILEVKIEELGFSSDLFDAPVDFARLKEVTSQLKEIINTDPAYREYLRFPDREGYGAVFGAMVTDKTHGKAREGTKGAELGVYFFGGNHIDRSPTGSAAAARAALDAARGNLKAGDSWTYHSLPTHAFGLEGMVATVLEDGTGGRDRPGVFGPVKVQIEGKAFYTGYSTILQEDGDILGEKGFLLDELSGK